MVMKNLGKNLQGGDSQNSLPAGGALLQIGVFRSGIRLYRKDRSMIRAFPNIIEFRRGVDNWTSSREGVLVTMSIYREN